MEPAGIVWNRLESFGICWNRWITAALAVPWDPLLQPRVARILTSAFGSEFRPSGAPSDRGVDKGEVDLRVYDSHLLLPTRERIRFLHRPWFTKVQSDDFEEET